MRFKPKTSPRSYQVEALKRAFATGGRYGLFLAPRTGKTKIAVDFCAALFLASRAQVVLVVCQLTGHPVWEEQLARHCAVPYRLVVLPQGSRLKIQALKRVRRDKARLTFVLINYESFWRIEDAILALAPQVLVCDEGHKLKNRTAKQSRSVHRVVQRLDPYRLLLTGTAIANSPLDVFSEYMVIDDSVFGRRWSDFAARYALFYGYYQRQVKYKNISDLRRRARSRATVLTAEECLDLPERSYQVVPVKLSRATRRVYDEMATEFITFLEDGDHATAAIKLTQMMRLSQITGGYVKTEGGAEKQVGADKLNALDSLLDELIEGGQKVVVFARFRWEIDAIEALCRKRRWRSWKYYGKGKSESASLQRQRLRYPQAFTKHPKPAVFIAQTATGSLSIDLGAASCAIFYSLDYSLINWEQCHDRILLHKGKLSYLYLLAENTNDAEVWRSLQDKKVVSSILDNKPKAIAYSTITNEDLQADAIKTAIAIFSS